jgi:hypothetical protein
MNGKEKSFYYIFTKSGKKIGPMCHNFFIANLLNLAFPCHLESIKEKRKEGRERDRERECVFLFISIKNFCI